jgi:ornithine carbamoyltransferase
MSVLESLKGKSILEISDLSPQQIQAIIEQTEKSKNSSTIQRNHQGKLLALLFTNNSTRTRISMFKAAAQLGVIPFELDPKTSQISRGEPVEDTCGVFDQMLDALAIRTSDHDTIKQFRDNSNSTVVYNALSDLEHPLQAVADLQTIHENFGQLKGLKVAYCGAFNNVARSLMLGCLAQGINVSLACPNLEEIDSLTKFKAQQLALENNCKVEFTDSAKNAAQNANVIYTDVWVSMGQNEDQKQEIIGKYTPFQVNQELMNYADNKAIAMHCLPAHRGEEITAEIMSKQKSAIMQQAGNRLHTFRTILDFTLQK